MLKFVTARRRREEFTAELAPYFWNRAYALISVAGRASIETLLRYSEDQDDPRKLGQPLN